MNIRGPVLYVPGSRDLLRRVVARARSKVTASGIRAVGRFVLR